MEKEKISQEKIIKTAEILITQLNSSEITLSQIAQKLGVTHAAIYKHFRNKQELWEAVTTSWFHTTIVNKIVIGDNSMKPIDRLHNMLWTFIDTKRMAYKYNSKMFILNTQYVDNNPYALRKILTSIYQIINKIMNWSDTDFTQAETVLSAFTIFTLPFFKDTWDDPDFQKRFENMWHLVKLGIENDSWHTAKDNN
ncbi:TetR/AcrR family transcriptional regulator [Leuconostoc gasicomitatum]|uniref:TetR/AcrR family transcriptional regulator n=1 Tax=Leuconostoc gasicomitatum TaxID=115778 RepID=A0A9Q3XTA2_9LACO|nr:TetR/AcrR family transcriptional regulator [Leuconostoc gasicomitatum]MBZ5962908.1 TetR/AcrR family transcriptional regulator [Leuconostoc gasicomitatum]